MHHDFDHGDMVANILDYRRTATEAQEQAGRAWYPAAGTIVTAIGGMTGIDTHRVAMVIAALSPRNPWRWNVADAYAFCSARAEGRTMPKATTFKRNWDAAWRALDPNSAVVWYTAAPKVRAFVACILGDEHAVVVDTWAVRVATGGSKSRVANDKEYAAVAAAYVEAARCILEPASHTQAITWLVAQTEGLATLRRGRHDLSFKAGTPSFIHALLA